MSAAAKGETEHQTRQRGYAAAREWHLNNPLDRSMPIAFQIRQQATQLAVSGAFAAGWNEYCDEIDALEQAEARADAVIMRRNKAAEIKYGIAQVLTWIALAAVLLLVAIYTYGFFLRQQEERQSVEDAARRAEKVRWIGTVTTQRHFYRPGDRPEAPTGVLTMGNVDLELGLKPDGTVVWRAYKPKVQK